jgi:hypothetical protein
MAQPDSVIVRPVANEDELARVHRLTHDAYVSMGYATPQPDRRLVHYGDFDHLPETTILVAMRGNELIGTASITADGPWGLTVEKDFKRICDSLRYAGRSLAVVWRLVIADSEKTSRHLLMGLIQNVIDLNAMQGASTTLITVNPKHQSVYEKLFHATVLSTNSFTKGLDQAPGVLLRMDYERIPDSWKRLAPKVQPGRAA